MEDTAVKAKARQVVAVVTDIASAALRYDQANLFGTESAMHVYQRFPIIVLVCVVSPETGAGWHADCFHASMNTN